MRKFLIRLTYFFIITLVLACLLDFFISLKLTKSTERIYQQWSGLYKDSLYADVIVLGSSRAWTQYNPAILDSILHTNSFVNGIDGSAINRQMIKYKNYCRITNNKPKLIIQNIDLGTMDTTYRYEREQFFPYFILDRNVVNSYQSYEKFNFLELYLPCYRYIGYPKEVKKALNLHKKYPQPLYKGYFGIDREYDGTKLREKKTIIACLNKRMIVEFDNFCAEIKSDSIDMCFVYAPVYIQATNKLVNKDEMYETYQTIANQYNIPILDYNYHPISYDSTNFYNATHLNKKGSILFSMQLAYDLDSLGILQK